MKRKVYFLSTCDTCKRIMNEVGVDESFEQQDIKFNPVTEVQVAGFYQHTGSYEALVNKRARKLKDALTAQPVAGDADYKTILLQDYTFLKRPVFEIGEELFVGNAAGTIEAIKQTIRG
ncbi:arsenate reductase family protein [Mangrovibacterium sp.]|uniref:arsenate reductase family protein n=1 Tax=Mangrovibacterium sp. TaxID=1961364 RepID=UPI0035647BD5